LRVTLAETFQRAYKSTVLDVILLEKAERIAASYPPSDQDRMRELIRAGTRRSRAATDLLDSRPVVAAILYRDAAIAYIAALWAARGERVEFGTDDIKAALEKLDAVRSELSDPPEGFERVRTLFTSDDPLALDHLCGRDAVLGAQDIDETVSWLRDAIEPRTVVEIRRSRLRRLFLFGLAGIGFLIWLGIAILSPTNIALHKRVIVSSKHPNSTAPEGGLTDGSNWEAYGVHTNIEDNPWVRVDLGEVYQLKKIKVYNRTDCCFDAALPLTLEISESEVGFTELDQRTTIFSHWSPWVFSPEGKRARYIQIRGPKGKFVALSELEVYGKKVTAAR
jgi:NedA-like, galactose-binding domain